MIVDARDQFLQLLEVFFALGDGYGLLFQDRIGVEDNLRHPDQVYGLTGPQAPFTSGSSPATRAI